MVKLKLEHDIPEIRGNIVKRLRRGASSFEAAQYRIAQMLKRSLKKTLARPPKGVRSKPGKPPKNDTKALSRSIQIIRKPRSFQVGPVGPPARYARFLEYGTKKMAARPWLRPAARRIDNESTRLVRSILRNELPTD